MTGLETREVPAALHLAWEGGYSSNAYYAPNWIDADSGTPAPRRPAIGNSLTCDGRAATDCLGLVAMALTSPGGPVDEGDPPPSIRLGLFDAVVLAADFHYRLEPGEGLSAGTLEIHGGHLDQYLDRYDQSMYEGEPIGWGVVGEQPVEVLTEFKWDGTGVINHSDHLSTISLIGATATIDPSAGLLTGSTLTFASRNDATGNPIGATGVATEGVVTFLYGAGVNVNQFCSLQLGKEDHNLIMQGVEDLPPDQPRYHRVTNAGKLTVVRDGVVECKKMGVQNTGQVTLTRGAELAVRGEIPLGYFGLSPISFYQGSGQGYRTTNP